MARERFGWLQGVVRPRPAVNDENPILIERERASAEIASLKQEVDALTRAVAVRDQTIREREAAVREREALLLLREREIELLARPDRTRRVIPLGRETLLVELDFGGRIIVPTWNVDVAVALVRDGGIEPWTASAVKALLRPGDTFLNVGVNLGYYLVLGAHCVDRAGTVIGIEANRSLFPYLMRTVHWTGFPHTIRLFNCAASDVDGQSLETRFDPQYLGGMSIVEALRFPDVADRDHSWSKTLDSERLEDAMWENADLAVLFDLNHEWRNSFSLFVKGRCRTKRIDTLLPDLTALNLMLLDIEGSEAAAILGAERVLRRSPDLNIIMEWAPWYALRADNRSQTEAMYGLLQELGYRFYRIRHEGFNPQDAVPCLSPLPDKAALFQTPHNDVLISKDPDRFVAGWSRRFVPY